jgi:phosphate transport system permease protein
MRVDPRLEQNVVKAFLALFTAITVFILLFIIVYILRKGIPVIDLSFLFRNPVDMGRSGGIFSTIIGTIVLTAVAVLIATPLGVGTAIFLTEYTWENRVTRIIRFGADCLAGIPSIIFGLFGFILFVTKLRFGWSILSGGLTLAFMILPTIIRTSEEAIRSVPAAYRQVSFSLPGIVTGIILSVGRSIGETAAVIFTAGSALHIPSSVFSSSRTMAVHFYILAREGISMPNAYGTAAVLVIAILIINVITYYLMERFIRKYS